MMPVAVSGVEAEVRWGYHLAASLRTWTVTRTEAGDWTLVGALTESDAFRLAQQPLVFVAAHASGVWRRPITSLETSGVSLSAVLGPEE